MDFVSIPEKDEFGKLERGCREGSHRKCTGCGLPGAEQRLRNQFLELPYYIIYHRTVLFTMNPKHLPAKIFPSSGVCRRHPEKGSLDFYAI